MLWPAELFPIPPSIFLFSNSFYICTCTSAFITRAIYSIIHHRGHAFFLIRAQWLLPFAADAAPQQMDIHWRQCNPLLTASQQVPQPQKTRTKEKPRNQIKGWGGGGNQMKNHPVWNIASNYNVASIGNFQLKRFCFELENALANLFSTYTDRKKKKSIGQKKKIIAAISCNMDKQV